MDNGTVHRRHRVVITGIGAITALGHNAEETWASILEGQSGIGPFTLLNKEDHVAGTICEVKDFDPNNYMDRRDARRRDRYQQLATVAAREAMEQAKLPIDESNSHRIGIILGTGVGGIRTLVEQGKIFVEKGLRRVTPFAITMIMPNGAAGMLAIDYGIHGPTTTITTACASASDAIGHAYRAIRSGDMDAALTGGSESIMATVALAGFERAGATSTKSEVTPQPFDKTGMVWLWGKEPVCSFWKAWNMPKRVGPTFWQKSVAMVRQQMPFISQPLHKVGLGLPGQCVLPFKKLG